MAIHPAKHLRRGARGMTVVELMTVVGLMSVMGGIAYSTLQPYAQQYRVKAAAMLIGGELSRARQDAIRTRLCHFYQPGGGATFQIIRDNPAAPNCQLDANDVPVRTIDLSMQFPSVTFSSGSVGTDPYGAAVTGPNPGNLRFEPRGLVTATGGSTIFVSSSTYGPMAVTVSAAGAVRAWRQSGAGWK